jgi:hypothetical protein
LQEVLQHVYKQHKVLVKESNSVELLFGLRVKGRLKRAPLQCSRTKFLALEHLPQACLRKQSSVVKRSPGSVIGLVVGKKCSVTSKMLQQLAGKPLK